MLQGYMMLADLQQATCISFHTFMPMKAVKSLSFLNMPWQMALRPLGSTRLRVPCLCFTCTCHAARHLRGLTKVG